MTSVVQQLRAEGLLPTPPPYVVDNIQYECVMGSVAYGTANDDSDQDIYGFCIPNKSILFPHTVGYIKGFGKAPPSFDQYIKHHINRQSNGREYDVTVYNIVKYFHLCMDNNPNMLDSLFVPRRCILHQTNVGNIVRESRKKFLHKGSWHKHKGYAFSQLHKMRGQKRSGKRLEIFNTYGYDLKFAMHCVRLLLQAEMILTEHDLDLERNREQLKSIRRGEWTEQEIMDWASKKEKALEEVYANSDLPWGPNEEEIKGILINCLEEHYGSLKDELVVEGVLKAALRNIKDIVEGVL